jgi:hypothetical protein
MTHRVPPRLAAYAREIERHWNALMDGPVVLSPRDWERIRDWHERGIPMQIVREAMDSVAERRTRARAPRGLGRVASAVEEAWRVVLDGRLAPDLPEADRTEAGRPAIDSWRDALANAESGSRLARLITSAIDDLERGKRASEVERRIDDELPRAVPESTLRTAYREADAALERFRDRMSDSTLETTRDKIVVSRLRRQLRLPSLDNDDEV